MATRPGDETNGARADREQLIEALKAAFVAGRLSRDEFYERVGQALAAYAQLDALAADIPPARTAMPSAVPSAVPAVVPAAVETPEAARQAYNRGLVARATFGGAGVVMVAVFAVVTAVSGNPFVGFLAGGALGSVMVVLLGTISTFLLWVLESSGDSSRPKPPGNVTSPATACGPGHNLVL